MKYTLTITKNIDDEDYNITKLIGKKQLTDELLVEILDNLLDNNTFFDDIDISLKIK